ncbi:hypothetical protein GCM10009558_063150 [Virgisporangium aurantiacum]
MAVTAGPSAIGVLGMGTHLPARRLGNDEVAAPLGLDPAWIARRTGILNRHAAEPHEASSDLAAAAVRAALSAAGISADDVGLLLLATSTPDELGPATACRVQAAVGARNAVAMDVTAACSGWLFAAKVAHDWLRAGQNGDIHGGTGDIHGGSGRGVPSTGDGRGGGGVYGGRRAPAPPDMDWDEDPRDHPGYSR